MLGTAVRKASGEKGAIVADIKLTVSAETSDGADNIIFMIGSMVAMPLFAKSREVVVSAPGSYTYDYVISGDPGGKASYEVKQGETVVLAKKERTIRPGRRRFNGGGNLEVK